jgi:Glycosyl hydrolase family 26
MLSLRLRSLLLWFLAFLSGATLTAPAVVEAKVVRGREDISARRSLGRQDTKAGSIYWGAAIGDQLTGDQAPWDMRAAAKLEAMLGKSMSLIHFMAPFAHCSSSGCSYYRFPAEQLETIRRHGAIPFFSWSSQSIPSKLDEPDFELSDVIEGRFDDFIRQWAKEARRWGHPFFLRFDWEMNGDWFPWGEGANGNRPGEYVAAWRHVHDIFSEVGATNVTWVWCPNVDIGGTLGDLSSLYPGDSYVDWAGLDGYNSGSNPGKDDHWRSFDEIYSRTYRELVQRIAPGKPIAIGEIGSSEQGGSKAQWISEMLRALPARYPRIRALVWLDKYEGELDWPIETSQGAVAAFRAGLRNPAYAGARFSSYSAAGAIRPPGG